MEALLQEISQELTEVCERAMRRLRAAVQEELQAEKLRLASGCFARGRRQDALQQRAERRERRVGPRDGERTSADRGGLRLLRRVATTGSARASKAPQQALPQRPP